MSSVSLGKPVQLGPLMADHHCIESLNLCVQREGTQCDLPEAVTCM